MQATTGKTGQRADLIAVLVMLAVFLAATWMSWGFSPKARLAPLFVSACCVVFVLVDLLPRFMGRHRDTAPVTPADTEMALTAPSLAPDPAHGESGPSGQPLVHSSLNAILTMLAPFVVLVFIVGLLPAALLFIFAYIRLVGNATLLSAALYAVLTFLAIWTLFVGLLGVFMYRGVFDLYIPFISG